MTEPESIPQRRFVWPADYYSAPTPRSVLPAGVTYGCGGASALVLLLIFVGGALLSSGGFASFMDLAIGTSIGEMRGLYTKEVTDARRKSLEAEIETMREHLRNERVSIVALQPFLETLRSAIYDRKVTEQEARTLEENVRKINMKSQSRKVSESQRR
jgi:hypothetical protein